MPKIYRLLLFTAVMVIMTCGPARAHSVVVFAWVEGDTVHVEGKFGSGRMAVNAPVEVYDPEENLLLTGVTDENGEFSFKVPRKTEMKVVLIAGMGHRGEWTIPASDLAAAGSAGTVEASAPGSKKKTAAESASTAGIAAATDSSRESSEYVTAAEMQAAMEAALDRKLKPVMKLLVDEKQGGPSMTDILGGIGYIFGLAGVAAYMASRGKRS